MAATCEESPMAAGTSQRERLAAVVEPVVNAAGYDLEEILVTPAGRRRLVRVVVDSDAGVSLDEVADVSRAISVVLDEQDGVVGAAPYVLEVSSPGVDRPLRTARHWRRAAGRLVEVPVRDQGTVTGRVRSADDAGVVLAVAGADREFGYDVLGHGRVQVEFSREEDDA
jgi:ribosome maturation factor RimP